MKMVAAAKLRKAQMQAEQARPYAEKMTAMLGSLSAAATETLAHPYFDKRIVRKQTLVVITSDRGLCGAFNANVIRRAEQWLAGRDPAAVELVCIGKRGYLYFRRRPWSIIQTYTEFNASLDYPMTRGVVGFLTSRFIAGDTDEIFLIYNQFHSTSKMSVIMEKYLNIDRPQSAGGAGVYIFEPGPDAIFADLLPRYALVRCQAALADSFASEHATRMMAMTIATTNAGDMIDQLTLQYNKARQAAITKELLEVVSGADALTA
jgi:F-type H+-transporting ATPase subunit gamma